MVTKNKLTIAEINEMNADLSASWAKENDRAIGFADRLRSKLYENFSQ